MCTLCEARANGFSVYEFNAAFSDNALTDVQSSLYFVTASAASSVAAVGKVSYDYEEAALAITDSRIGSRDNLSLKWDDDDYSTGLVEYGQYEENALGTPGIVTYGFLSETGNTGTPDIGGVDRDDLRVATSAQQVLIEYAMSMYSEVANIEFVAASGLIDDYQTVDIAITTEAGTNGGITSYSASYSGNASDLSGELTSAVAVIGRLNLGTYGNYTWVTAIHELGHAIGLSHPSDYNGVGFNYTDAADYYEDTLQYSVMSYWDESNTGADYGDDGYPLYLMLHDIAAIQRLYGMNTTSYSTDTTYGYNSNTGTETWDLDDGPDYVVGAVWDVGGVDGFDFSAESISQYIDLQELAFSDVNGLTGNLAIAAGVKIEDAIGGSGDDTLIGNDLDSEHIDAMYLDIYGDAITGAVIGYDGDNYLDGGAGHDYIAGLSGDDYLLGGLGADELIGGDGNDEIFGGDGADIIYGDGAIA